MDPLSGEGVLVDRISPILNALVRLPVMRTVGAPRICPLSCVAETPAKMLNCHEVVMYNFKRYGEGTRLNVLRGRDEASTPVQHSAIMQEEAVVLELKESFVTIHAPFGTGGGVCASFQ